MSEPRRRARRAALIIAVAAVALIGLILRVRSGQQASEKAPAHRGPLQAEAPKSPRPLRIDRLSEERTERVHPLEAPRAKRAAPPTEAWTPFEAISEESEAAILAKPNLSPAAEKLPPGVLETIVADLENELQEKGGLYGYNSRHYGATLDNGWVEFATNHQFRIGSPTISYALEQIRVGDQVVAKGGPGMPQPRLDRRAVYYARGTVEEEYELRPEALEQSFIIKELPQKRGAITITGLVSTNLATPEDGTRGEKLAFSYKGKDMIVVSQAVAIDAGGRRQPLEIAWADDRMTLTVPAGWVQEAQLPIVVDPLVGSPFTVFSTTDPNTNYTVGNAWPVRMMDAAYSPTNTTWFVVWTQRWGSGGTAGFDYDVRAQRVTATGTLTGGVVGIDTSSSGAYEPSITYSSGSAFDRYLIAYRHDPTNNLSDTDQRIQGKVHGGDGVFVTLNPFVIQNPTGQDMAPTSAFDGTNWYVSYTNKVSASNYNVRGRFVSTAGTPGTSANPDTAADAAYMSSVSYANGAYMIVWNKGTTSSGTISARTMLPSGTFPTAITTVEPNTNTPREADVSGGGTKFLIVWRNNSNQSISGRTADAGTGATITFPTSTFTIQTSSASARSTPRAAYSATSDAWFTLWADAATGGTDVYGAKVSSAGVVSPVEQVSSDASWEWRPELAWNSATNEMLLVYNFGSGSPSFAVRGQRYGMTSGSAPPAPANFRGTAQTTTSVLWEWDNVAGETAFEVRDAAQVLKGAVGADVLAFTESSGLAENTSYSRHVNATNASGASPDSNSAAKYTTVHDPVAGDFTVTAVSTSQIDIVVTAPPNSAAGSTACEIDRSPDGSSGWVTVKTFFPGGYSFSDTGRASSTAYFYRFRYRNGDAVVTAYSPVKSATTPAPPVPANFAGAAQTATSILWSWNNVAGESGFEVRDAAQVVKGSVAADVLSFSESTGLTENTAYLRHVNSKNGTASSADSNAVTTYTKIHDPVAGDFTVTAVSSTQIDVAVTAPPNSAAGSTGCEIDRSPDGSTGWVTIKAFSAVYFFSDTGRSPGTTYYYRFRYRNGDAVVTAYSPVKNATTPSGSPPPAPANFAGAAQTTTAILWSWNDVAGETSFEVRDAAQVVKGTAGADVLSLTESTGLAENLQYSRHVNAVNAAGASADSNVVLRYTKVHDPVAGDFTVTAVSTSQIDVVVTPPPGSASDSTACEIDRSPDGTTGWVTVKAFAVAGYSFSDTALSSSTPYYYRFRYRNGDAIVTADSPVKSATTPAPPVPANFAGAAQTTASILWSWDNVAGESGFEVRDSGQVVKGAVGADVLSLTESTGLSENTAYGRHVNSKNGSASSADSNVVSKYTLVHDPVAGDFSLSVISSSQITITVVLPPGSGTGSTACEIERSPDGTTGWQIRKAFAVAGYVFNDTGLSASTTYYYRFKYQNGDAVATAVSPVKNATTQAGGGGAPLPPTNVRTIAYATVIDVEWDPSPSSNVAGYHVYRKLVTDPDWPGTPLNMQLPVPGVVTNTKFRDNTVSTGTNYQYRVTAVGN